MKIDLKNSLIKIPQYLNFKNLILVLAFNCSFSLILIASRLSPLSDYSKSMNRCVNTTMSFLENVPGFKAAGEDGIEAMSVSLCNGSTPQKADNSTNES
tara:strand:+ start:1539 stop:1835 length:297 start_codon:yes stop_codon:yes gene_type:complete